MDLAFEKKIPIVAFLCSPGVSVKEGIGSGVGYTNIINKNISYSGSIPQIAVVVGMTMGAPAYSATLMDFILFNKSRSTLMVTGPQVIKEVMGEETSPKELGGSEVHSHSTGIVDTVDANIREQIETLKCLVTLLPDNDETRPSTRRSLAPRNKLPKIPSGPKAPFDILKVIRAIVDCSEIFEVKPNYGKSIITALAYIGGRVTGVLANQGLELSGALDSNASRKASRFLRLCNAYNIPVLTLIDVPGFMPGKEQESEGLLRYGAQLCMGLQTDIPRLSLVVRRAYGAAAYILMQSKNKGGSLSLCLSEARIAIMGYEAAYPMVYGEDNEENRADYYKKYEDPQLSLKAGLIDKIITLENARKLIVDELNKTKNRDSISTFKERLFP